MAGVGAPLATAFVRVRPDTSGFGRDLKASIGREGSKAGDEFGKGFTRDAQGRLRDSRGKFVAEGDRIGKSFSKALNKGIDLKQFSTLAQKLRDIRTIFNATLAPIQKFSAQIAKMAVVAGAGSVALLGGAGLVGGVLALVGAVSQAALALPVLVPAVGAFGAAMLTAKIATLGVADAIGEALAPVTEKLSKNAQELVGEFAKLVPQLTRVKNAVQDAAFFGLRADVATLARVHLPALTSAATGLAAIFNGALRAGVRGLLTPVAGRDLATLLSDAKTAAAQFAPQLARLPALFLAVARSASPAFRGLTAGLSTAIGGVLDRLAEAARSGALTASISKGVAALTSLASTAGSVFSVIRSVVKGASDAFGGALLTNIARVTKGFADFLKTTQGKQAISAVFAAALPVLRTLGGLLAAIGPELAKLAPVVVKLADAFLTGLKPVIPVAGQLARTLGTALASVLPAVSAVAVALGGALTQAITILQPVIAPLADAIARLLSPTGLLAAVFRALAPVLPILADGLVRVVGVLAGGLVQVLDKIAPQLPALAQAFADLAVAIAQGLADALIQILPYLPGIVRDLTSLVAAAAQAAPTILSIVGPILIAGAAAIRFQLGLQKLVGTIVGTIIGAVIRLAGVFTGSAAAAGAAAAVFVRFASTLMSTVRTAVSVIVGLFAGLPARVLGALARLGGGLVSSVGGALASMRRAIATGLNAALAFFAGLPGRIRAAVGNLGGVLFDAGASVIRGLIDGIRSMLGSLGSALGSVGGFIADHKGPLPKDRRILRPAGRAVMGGLIAGIESGRVDLGRTLAAVSGQIAVAPTGATAAGAGITAGQLRSALGGMAIRFDGDGLARLVSDRQSRVLAAGGRA